MATTASADGINAGYRGIYICSASDFKGTCFWNEIQPEDQDGKCLHIHSPDGYKSFGPDAGLSVEIWDTQNCGGQEAWLKDIMCPGRASLPMGALGSAPQTIKDLWVEVRVPDRKKVGKLSKECEFDNSDFGLKGDGTWVQPSTA